jgi:hypothetical protein
MPVMKCSCVFWEFEKRRLATRKDKIKIFKTKRDGYATCLPLGLSVSHEERCEVLACFHVVVKMYPYSLEERVFIVKIYWITGSIKNCQRQAGCVAVSFLLDLSYLIFSLCQLTFCEFPKHPTTFHYRYDMQMYCTFVNQHFPGYLRVGRNVQIIMGEESLATCYSSNPCIEPVTFLIGYV